MTVSQCVSSISRKCAWARPGRIVDQDVDSAPGVQHLCEGRLYIGGLAGVTRDRQDRTPARLDGARRLVQCSGAARRHGYPGALLRKSLRDAFADASACTRHDRHFAFQCIASPSPSVVSVVIPAKTILTGLPVRTT